MYSYWGLEIEDNGKVIIGLLLGMSTKRRGPYSVTHASGYPGNIPTEHDQSTVSDTQMITEPFNAYVVKKDAKGEFSAGVEKISIDDLPQGDVIVQVKFSSLNYKDALSATGHPGVTRYFPHVPGLDASGVVVASDSQKFYLGDEVVVTGQGQGASFWGGFSEYIRVNADRVVSLPAGLSLREAMICGTAGFTAVQCIEALIKHEIDPDRGDIVVTGATGGVGSMSIAILAKLGYNVVAATGKSTKHDYLMKLGAAKVIDRQEVNDQSNKPLLRSRWAGAVDTVGGNILATILRATDYRGCVTACGLTCGSELNLTVYPFILRGVQLIGMDSSMCPMAQRIDIWKKLAGQWKPDYLEQIATTISFSQLNKSIQEILAGRITGRLVVTPMTQ